MAFTREAVSARHRPTSFGWSFPVSGAVLALTAFGAPLTDYTIAADAGAATVTGTDASLEYGRLLAADSGTFTVAGTDANLEFGREIAADGGACAVTGTDATLGYGRRLGVESGAFIASGTDANLEFGRRLSAEAGAFAATGTDATLIYGTVGGYTLAASGGAFALTGGDASLRDSGGTSTAFYISYRSGWRHTTAGRSGQRYGVIARSKPLTS